MKRKIIIALSVVVSAVVFAFGLTACKSSAVLDNFDRHNVDTRLLKDYKIVCDIKGETFTGRANSYGVLAFKSEPTAFLQSFSTDKSDGFSSEKNEEFEHRIDTYFSDLKIPSKYCPDWNEDYIWYVSGGFDKIYYLDTLFMIYFPNNLELVVCETGH